MKKLIIITLIIMALSSVSFAGDAPHGNDVICAICHSTVGTTGGAVPSPFWGESYTPPNVEETLLNQFCLGCHDQATGGSLAPTAAIQVRTHSSYSTGTKYGTWSVECIACHNPHYQRQFMFYRNLPSIKLAEGTVQTIAYLNSENGIPQSRITYTALTGKTGWTDPAKWYNKSSDDRGAIIYPNGSNGTYSYNILSATDTEIIVRGDVTAGVTSGLIGPDKKFMITYGMLIKERIYAPGKTDPVTFKSPTVGTVGPSTGSYVRFLDSEGTNSFAVNDLNGSTDSSRDGICQVCHSQTTHWRYDGSEADHNSGTRCTTCHPHQYGFKPMCDKCHGYPPSSTETLVFKDKDGNAVTSDSSGAGAHTVHVAKFFVCQTCHTGGMTTQSGGDYLINIGFNLNGSNLGGNYDGNTERAVYPPVAGATSTTTVTDGKTLACSSLYCHSSGQSADGESATPEYAETSPIWTGTVVCGNCHSTSGRSTGSHTRHIASGADCGECHIGATPTAYSAATHVNRSIDVGLGTYSAGGAPGNGYGNCSTASCHVSAYGPGYVQTPTWGSSVEACSACHAGTPSTGSHTLHLTFSGISGACGFCHDGAVKETSGGTGHRDGNIDVINNYPANVPKHEAGSGYSNCSMINCHGTLSPTWGNNTSTPTCEKCHGSAATAIATGTFKDTGGLTTGPKAGAHASHLRNAHDLRSSPVTCNQCHDDHLDGGLTDTNHMNGIRDFDWGSLATKNGAITPVYSSGPGSCSNVYCHGNSVGKGLPGGTGRTPVWSDTSYLSGATAEKCGACHGYPPGGTHPASNDCNHCHLHVNADNNGFDDRSMHINMTVDYTDVCINCHDDLSATHAKHTDAVTFLSGKTLGAGDFGKTDWWYNVTYISGSPKFACGYCHPNTVSTHINGTRNLDLNADNPDAAGTVKAKNATPESYTQTQGTSVTCSSVYCHSNGHSPYVYRDTPDWHGGSFANPDKCANCHGNSPYDGSSAHSAHVVGIHYQDVYTGDSGKLTPGGVAHGNSATSTTINCNVCHRNTVTMSRNKLNTVCNTCHSGDDAGYVMTIDTGSSSHVNGTPDIAFGSFSVKSKAQVRDSIASVEELNNSWERTNGYKEADSYDASRTSPSFNSGSCSSVACHNGNKVEWTDGSISCRACHTNLPR